MTNENVIGGTALVNPSSPSSELKRVLRSAQKKGRQHVDPEEDSTLVKEEEKIMDEEITSEDDETTNAAAANMERKLLTVALVKSVVETGKASSGTDDKGDNKTPRYGLRKRRRPAGRDLERLEHNQSTKNGGLARVHIKREEGACDGNEPKNIITPPPLLPPTLQQPPPILTSQKPPISQDPQPPLMQVKMNEPLPTPPLPSTSSVPNPLSQPVHLPVALAPSATISLPIAPGVLPHAPASLPSRSSTALPLPKAILSAEPPKRTKPPSAMANNSAKADSIISEATEKRRVTINRESHPGENIDLRSRGFSIDMDCKLCNENVFSRSRIRRKEFSPLSFSPLSTAIGLGLDDDASAAASVIPSGGGRNRAFSFECFSFGISAEEPLPPLAEAGAGIHAPNVSNTEIRQRPRGDSIIFDPVSFQDGGIHEQNALFRTHDTQLNAINEDPTLSNSQTPGMAPLSVPAPYKNTIGPNQSSAALSNSANVAGGGTTTFSLELLNKDGRIGIYLPEARRARIARFHAKRAKRIWRKRIKYDCRKKLADSRPRIKGRFVKRSDMDS